MFFFFSVLCVLSKPCVFSVGVRIGGLEVSLRKEGRSQLSFPFSVVRGTFSEEGKLEGRKVQTRKGERRKERKERAWLALAWGWKSELSSREGRKERERRRGELSLPGEEEEEERKEGYIRR